MVLKICKETSHSLCLSHVLPNCVCHIHTYWEVHGTAGGEHQLSNDDGGILVGVGCIQGPVARHLPLNKKMCKV